MTKGGAGTCREGHKLGHARTLYIRGPPPRESYTEHNDGFASVDTAATQIINMPTYKLNYFDVRGRGELARYLFKAAGVPFEDNRLGGESWQQFKSSTPFGQMPVLEKDGKMLAQSGAIARYLAREFNLAGKDSWEQAICDQIMCLVDDMFTEFAKSFFEKDEEKKKELTKKLKDEVLPKFLGQLEGLLTKNGGKYFVGNALTVADLAVYCAFDTPVKQNPSLMDKYPQVKAQRAMIESSDKLGKYIKERKPTDL